MPHSPMYPLLQVMKLAISSWLKGAPISFATCNVTSVTLGKIGENYLNHREKLGGPQAILCSLMLMLMLMHLSGLFYCILKYLLPVSLHL